MTARINSHNEWDTLREVIVGTADRSAATLTWPKPDPIPETALRAALELAAEAYPQWLLDEANEDLEGACAILRKAGVVVRRPSPHDLGAMYASPHGWRSTGNNLYNVRDLHLVVGNILIESASPLRNRQFESNALYDIWYEYFEQGFTWICAPKPTLKQEVMKPYFRDAAGRQLTREDARYAQLTGGRVEKLHELSEDEILFEAANTVRMGRDLLYLVSSSGNARGARWLQTVLEGRCKVHTTRDIYRSSHIDSTVVCLRPGLVLLNSVRVNEANCPALFDGWEKVYFDDVAPLSQAEAALQRDVRDPIRERIAALGFETTLGHMASPWVGMNVLSLDPHTVMVDDRQASLMRLLEHHGITPVPVRLRHPYTFGGGMHCATLDTVRDSRQEGYFE